mgnify:CR=1 FL=1
MAVEVLLARDIEKENLEAHVELCAERYRRLEEKFENKSVSREKYYNFFTNLPSASGQDDLYSMVNWISFTNPELADKLYNMI